MCILTQYAVEMRVCAEKNCGADISNRRGNAKRCLECAKNRYWECERAYFKSPKGRAAQKRYRETPRRRALHKEYVRAYLASAKGKAAMKRYRQSAKGQAAGQGRPPKKSTTNRPREGLPSRRYGSATRNTRRLIENPPGPTACDPAWENKACRANKTVWFLSPSSSPIWTGRSEHEHRNLRHPQRGPLT